MPVLPELPSLVYERIEVMRACGRKASSASVGLSCALGSFPVGGVSEGIVRVKLVFPGATEAQWVSLRSFELPPRWSSMTRWAES